MVRPTEKSQTKAYKKNQKIIEGLACNRINVTDESYSLATSTKSKLSGGYSNDSSKFIDVICFTN